MQKFANDIMRQTSILLTTFSIFLSTIPSSAAATATEVKKNVLARFENWALLAKKVIEVEFPSYSIMANLARATSLASKVNLGTCFL